MNIQVQSLCNFYSPWKFILQVATLNNNFRLRKPCALLDYLYVTFHRVSLPLGRDRYMYRLDKS